MNYTNDYTTLLLNTNTNCKYDVSTFWLDFWYYDDQFWDHTVSRRVRKLFVNIKCVFFVCGVFFGSHPEFRNVGLLKKNFLADIDCSILQNLRILL